MGKERRPLTPKQQRREEKKRQQKEAKRQRQQERQRKRQALNDAYTAQDPTGESTQTVDSSTLPCPKAKAGIEVTVASQGGRAVNAARVTFSATGSSLEKETKGLKAFLPLKFATDVTFKGVVTDPPAAGFEEAELEDTARAPAGELARGTLTFTARPSAVRVKVVKTGTTDAVPGARVKLGGQEKAAGATGALFEQLLEDEYDIEVLVDENDWLKPDTIEGRVVDPARDDDEESVEVDPRPWIKVKVHDTKANAPMARVTVKLTQPDDENAEKTTNDQGLVEHKMDEQPEDGTCKIRELVTERESSAVPPVLYEFVAIEES